MSNSNPWDIRSSLHRNPSTATGTSMFSSDYYHPQRYDSRRSIGSTVGPPPVSPRPGGTGPGTSASATTSPVTGPSQSANNLFQPFRNSTGSPWPVPSAPSSPAPAPPPAVQTGGFQRTRPGTNNQHNPSMSSSSFSSSSQSQTQGLSPLNIPELGSGRISPASHPATPVQRPGSHLSHNSRGYPSRASMEHEFTIKHAQLVDQAKLLLAEMTTLQVLGPIHGAASTSDDHGGGGGGGGGDDASTSSFFSGSGSNTTNTTTTNPNNNTSVFYEQDEASMAALSAILQGKLGSLVSKPPPRPARAVAREVVSKFGTSASSPSLLGSGSGITTEDEDAEAEAIELLMEDYEAVLGWARSSSGSSQRPISSAASTSSSSQGQGQGRSSAQIKVKSCLDERQVLLEAALPAWLGHLPSEAMMHFGHEKLYLSANRAANLSRGTSVHSGVSSSGNRNGNGNGYTNGNGNGNGNLAVNGTHRRERSSSNIPAQIYANTTTFTHNLPIEEIPRRRFLKTDDNYAWDMSELASALENDLSTTNTSRGVRGANVPPALRNPVTRAFFTPEDVNKILAHPMGRTLGPYPTSRRRSVSPVAVRPASPVPLPESVSAFERSQQDGEREPGGLRVASRGSGSGIGSFRPRLYGHDEGVEPDDSRRGLLDDTSNGGMDTSWSAPPPPYNASSETPAPVPAPAPAPAPAPQSPTSPPPPPPPVPIVNRSSSPSYTTAPTSLRPYSPPSSPPPLLGTASSSQPPEPRPLSPPAQAQSAPQPQPQPQPQPRPPLPRPLPGSYPTFSWEEREQDNDDRFNPHEFLAAPPPAPAPAPVPASVPVPAPNLTTSISSPNLTPSTSNSNSGNNNDRERNSRSPVPVLGRSTSPNITTRTTADPNSTAGLIQQIASGLASIPIPTAAANTTTNTSSSTVGGEYRSSLLGNLNPTVQSSSNTNTSSPSSPSYPPPLIPRPLSTSTSTGTGPNSRPPWLPPLAPTSVPAPAPPAAATNNNNSNNDNQESTSGGTSWEARERERERERERGRWETRFANANANNPNNHYNSNYFSASYSVATPPPSGPIPVSSLTAGSLNAAANSSTSNMERDTSELGGGGGASGAGSGSGAGYRISGYFSLGASHRNISIEQSQQQSQQYQPPPPQQQSQVAAQDGIQRGRWEAREYARLNGFGSGTGIHAPYGRSPATNTNTHINPFASSRDPSTTRDTGRGGGEDGDEWWASNGRGPVGRGAEMDAGPFELADTPPRLPELSGGTIRRRRDDTNEDDDDDNDDAHSREWMGEFASRR